MDDDVRFQLLNEEMLEKLKREGKVTLPQKTVNVVKDRRWNMKTFASELLQGLMNGESAEEIANRIYPEIMSKTDLTGKTVGQVSSIIRKNEQSAIRSARTMVTGVENGGRLDSYRNLTSQGVVQKKKWMATPDDRTRPSHIDIDGEEQDIDVAFSNGCMYPGDGNGPAEEVWMCRCSMTSHIIGFKRSDGSISYVETDQEETLHDKQMDEEKERRRNK